jgi:hypothetical protein
MMRSFLLFDLRFVCDTSSVIDHRLQGVHRDNEQYVHYTIALQRVAAADVVVWCSNLGQA